MDLFGRSEVTSSRMINQVPSFVGVVIMSLAKRISMNNNSNPLTTDIHVRGMRPPH